MLDFTDCILKCHLVSLVMLDKIVKLILPISFLLFDIAARKFKIVCMTCIIIAVGEHLLSGTAAGCATCFLLTRLEHVHDSP